MKHEDVKNVSRLLSRLKSEIDNTDAFDNHEYPEGQSFIRNRVKEIEDILKIIEKPTTRDLQVKKLLGEMLNNDIELYERILDSGFAFQFNELTKLALNNDQL